MGGQRVYVVPGLDTESTRCASLCRKCERMPKIDLITGFLGSGKTTFLRKYAQYLIAQGKQIGILENDHGAVNVDMMLLQDLEGDQCELEMVSGGCDYDCHRRRFKTKLIAMGMSGYDRVLVEPSGVYDADEFYDVLHEEPLDGWYQIGNVIAIVNAGLEEELSEEAQYLLAEQVSGAGLVVLSRVQEETQERIDRTVARLNGLMEKYRCARRFSIGAPWDNVLAADWDSLTPQQMDRIGSCGYLVEDMVKLPVDRDNAFRSLYYMNLPMSEEELRQAAADLLGSSEYGRVMRVKGYAKTEDGRWLQLNAAADHIHTDITNRGQQILIVIGEDLDEERIGRRINKGHE